MKLLPVLLFVGAPLSKSPSCRSGGSASNRLENRHAANQPSPRCRAGESISLRIRHAAITLMTYLSLAYLAPSVAAQSIQPIYFFTNGATPAAELTLGVDGNFYGTTMNGGPGGYGTVFRITTDGTFATLLSFTHTNGAYPEAALTPGPDGNFYGTTENGGANGYGTVFQITTNGTLTTLASFAETNGANPYAGLTLGPDGNFYGTTIEGGSGDSGAVFQISSNGTLTMLASFDYANGAYPDHGLTLGPDGNFYGTASSGGSNNYGAVYQFKTNGALTSIYSFSPAVFNGTASFTNADGAYPEVVPRLAVKYHGVLASGDLAGAVGGDWLPLRQWQQRRWNLLRNHNGSES